MGRARRRAADKRPDEANVSVRPSEGGQGRHRARGTDGLGYFLRSRGVICVSNPLATCLGPALRAPAIGGLLALAGAVPLFAVARAGATIALGTSCRSDPPDCCCWETVPGSAMTAPPLSLWERAAKRRRKMKTRKRRLHRESSAPPRRPERRARGRTFLLTPP